MHHRRFSFKPRPFPENQNSPPLLEEDAAVKLADLRYAAEHEHVENLVDLLFRRVGVGWSKTMGSHAARRAAETVSDILGWDQTRIAQETQAYQAYLTANHRVRQSNP